MLSHTPRFDAADAGRLARLHFGIEGRADALPSERDQNFLIEPGVGGRVVLKIANALEERAMLEAQQAALAHLGPRLALVPRLVRALSGETMVEAECDGRRHLVWAITWIDGAPMASLRWRSPALLEDLGRAAGSLRRALVGFDHPAIHRDFHWDLANAPRVVEERRGLVDDAALGAAIDRVARELDRRVAPVMGALPRAAVHGDLNDHNVLVSGGLEPRVVGVVDYGDMVHGWAVADLAIAIAYAIVDEPDPLAAAAAVVRGAHAEHPLAEEEIAALWGLVLARLAMSACIAASQLRERPDNAYLGVSQGGIRASLPRLAAIPFALAEAAFRRASGLAPSPRGGKVAAWLASGRASLAPVMPLVAQGAIPLDLGVTSPLVSGDARENAEPPLTARIDAFMREAGARVAVGGYGEPRLLYSAPTFASLSAGAFGASGDEIGSGSPERRTVHLGIDLFADAGTPVHAPLDGVVHAFADNDAPQDYGPVIILEHATGDGTPFFTLYGHLSRESLEGLRAGQRVAAGERFASLGAAAVNGGWTPHLHLQIITDPLGLGTDFPGVARGSEREVWLALCPDPAALCGTDAARATPRIPKARTLAARRALLGGNLSLAYRDPLRIERGWMQYLFDEEARRFVDAYNNVPHVGHCHPRVVEAGARQMRLLNTNTRYLSDVVVEYAERLVALFPEPLRVCYLLNSASEANELALRLARAYTGARDLIVLEAAYHGNTTSLIDASPYKHAGPGGSGAPEWVHVAPLPDDYRGAHRRDDPEAGAKYAAHVGEIVASLRGGGRALSAFLAESCPSVGGQIMLPPDYLARAYRHVRAAGGVCIADEVQTGLGRIGTHAWAFEAQDVVPDVVVLGKPIGNGHPLAAVVTTRAIADAFDDGMEFFSTFGGSTASCATGLAVLDVMRDEGLQAHALAVGGHLLAGLREMAARHEIIGDVRGSGLFLGVELVRDRETREPATEEASFVANRMREQGVLLGTDGPWHNVVKIRPPMPFGIEDADVLLGAMEEACSRLSALGSRLSAVIGREPRAESE